MFIGDSIGCAPFTADLENHSKGASHYIWEMGDPLNTTVQKTDSTNVKFTYELPGRYFVNLIGIDSLYNPLNGQIYYCYTSFPGPDDDPFSILVLPSKHSGISGPDTLCVDDVGVFRSSGTGELDHEFWTVENGSRKKKEPGSSIERSFKTPGTYSIQLYPQFMGYDLVPRCIEKIEKKVLVRGIKADFEIDPNSIEPVFNFINKTNIHDARYSWNFDDPRSGPENISHEEHPTHNFKRRTGTFNICLSATIPPGCSDRVCKPLENWYARHIELYNVFTPGDDDQNDRYELVLEGELRHDFTVFNRWGEAVFESKKDGHDANEPIEWNGKVHNTGADCPEGTYFYVLEFVYGDEPDVVQERSGTITLIRD